MRNEAVLSETIPLFLRDRCTKEGHHTRADSLWRSYKTWLASHAYLTSKKLVRKDFLRTLSVDFGYPAVIQDKSVFVVGLRISRTHILPKENNLAEEGSVGNRIFGRYNTKKKHKALPKINPAYEKAENFLVDDFANTSIFIHSGNLDNDIAESVASIEMVRDLYKKRRGFIPKNQGALCQECG